MRPYKRGVTIPADLYAEISRFAKIAGVSRNRVINRLLEIGMFILESAMGPIPPAECAHISRTRQLSEITHGRPVWTRRRLVKLLGLRTAHDRRFTKLVQDGIVEIQQSGFAGDSMHHEKLARIRRDAPFVL